MEGASCVKEGWLSQRGWAAVLPQGKEGGGRKGSGASSMRGKEELQPKVVSLHIVVACVLRRWLQLTFLINF